MSLLSTPNSEEELMDRAYSLAGRTVQELAQQYNIKTPSNSLHAKGWLGVFLEEILGANAGNSPTQDFVDLKIELKSIPIDQELNPYETTYVCIVPLIGCNGQNFFESNFYNKIKKILWIPFDGSKEIPIAEKIFYTPFIWTPNAQELDILKQDWEEHMEKISMGNIETITAKDGIALQIRPKAANGKILTDAIGKDGQLIKTRPRGFYLRTSFTKKILKNKFL